MATRKLGESRVLVEPPGDWTHDAACVGQEQLFFPPDSDHAEHLELKRRRVAQAKAICKTCPVKVECHAYAEAKRIDFGVWAGIDRERKR